MNKRKQHFRAETVAAIEDLQTHAHSFFASHGLSQGFERRLILPRGLTDGGAYHELEDLILALARRLHGGDVLVGDPCRLPGDLVDQRAERLGEPCVIECGAPLLRATPCRLLRGPG